MTDCPLCDGTEPHVCPDECTVEDITSKARRDMRALLDALADR